MVAPKVGMRPGSPLDARGKRLPACNKRVAWRLCKLEISENIVGRDRVVEVKVIQRDGTVIKEITDTRPAFPGWYDRRATDERTYRPRPKSFLL